MLQYVHRADDALLDVIVERIEGALELPVADLMWGLAGRMLATLHLHTLSGQPRFLDLYRTQAEKLVWAVEQIDGVGRTWRPVIAGRPHQGLGAVHGVAGNAAALLAGLEHLPEATQAVVLDCTAETFTNTAAREGGHVNWRRLTDDTSGFRLCHCHGAPGIVTSLRRHPPGRSPELDRALLEAGELIYRAGPLRKGPSLCHGTAA